MNMRRAEGVGVAPSLQIRPFLFRERRTRSTDGFEKPTWELILAADRLGFFDMTCSTSISFCVRLSSLPSGLPSLPSVSIWRVRVTRSGFTVSTKEGFTNPFSSQTWYTSQMPVPERSVSSIRSRLESRWNGLFTSAVRRSMT